MRVETPDGRGVQLKDGNERAVFESTAGVATIPALVVPGAVSLGGVTVAPGSVVQSADRALTVAEINALYTTGIDVVAAPAAGYANIFVGAIAAYTYGSAAFTLGSAAGLAFRYTDKAGTQVAQCAVSGFIDQATDQMRYVLPWNAASGASQITPTAAATLNVSMLTGNTSVGTGCALKVRVFYVVVPTTL